MYYYATATPDEVSGCLEPDDFACSPAEGSPGGYISTKECVAPAEAAMRALGEVAWLVKKLQKSFEGVVVVYALFNDEPDEDFSFNVSLSPR